MFAAALTSRRRACCRLTRESIDSSNTAAPVADSAQFPSLTAHTSITETVIPAFTIVFCSPTR